MMLKHTFLANKLLYLPLISLLLLSTTKSQAELCSESYSGTIFGSVPAAYGSCREEFGGHPILYIPAPFAPLTIWSSDSALLTPTPTETTERTNLTTSYNVELGDCPIPFQVPPDNAPLEVPFQPNQTYCATFYDTQNGAITIQATTGANDTALFTNAEARIYTNPSITIQSGGTHIENGDNSPSTDDDTDFGPVNVDSGSNESQFLLVNYGSDFLNLTGSPRVEISGDTADFTVTEIPDSPVRPEVDFLDGPFSTTFSIQFDPTTVGLRSATVTILSDDPTRSPYAFAIQGTGTASGPVLNVVPVPGLNFWGLMILIGVILTFHVRIQKNQL